MADTSDVSHTPSEKTLNHSASSGSLSDVGVTTSGERVRFKIKDFTSKIYDQSYVVDKDWDAKVGVQITPSLIIHKFLAGGYQGGIYMVADAKGVVDETRLLKVLKKSAVLGDLEKEWAIGQALNVLANKDGHLVGFMKTYEAIRVEGESGIRGMFIERLNGGVVEDTVSDHKFSDPYYLQDVMYQVCTAVSRAYTVLGFKHADLRLTNVMEHNPDPSNPSIREFKVIDFGLSSIQQRHDSTTYQRLHKAVFSKLTHPDAMGKLFVKTINPAHQFSMLSEYIYKMAWLRHNDIYHILASLSHFTDDRTWPEEDKEVIQQFAELMKDVTGIKLRLKYLPKAELQAKKADKESEVKKLGYKVHHAFADFKHFNQRIASQACQRHKSNICPYRALQYPLFKGMSLPVLDGISVKQCQNSHLTGLPAHLSSSESGSEINLSALSLGDEGGYDDKVADQDDDVLDGEAAAPAAATAEASGEAKSVAMAAADGAAVVGEAVTPQEEEPDGLSCAAAYRHLLSAQA